MTIRVYSKTKDGNKKVATNFRVREFACSDGSDPIFIDLELVSILQKVRDHFGSSVTITSAYRTPPHNKAVGGTTYSQHLYGRAADIKVKGVSPKKVASYVNTLLYQKGGVGIYDTFVHVDTRLTKARWKG